MNRRERRMLRREMRAEALQYLRENKDATDLEVQGHLEEEFSGLGFDPASFLLIIKLIMEFISMITNRDP